VGAIMLSWLMDNPVTLKPLMVSKLNTVAQILLALVVLASLAFEFDAWWVIQGLTGLVTILTLASVALYLREWVRHMNGTKAGPT
jgi:cardiolipin synthase (CMP-forming)